MDHGGSPETAAAVAAATSEAGVLALVDDSDFVRQAYRLFLRRDPDLDGLRYFCDMAKQQGRLTVIAEIKKSDEAQRIAGAKPADPMAVAEAAPPEEDLGKAEPSLFDDGPELADLMELTDHEEFVTAAYRRTLGRDPDPDGRSHFIERLEGGESKQSILQGLAASEEARARGIDFTWQGQPWPATGWRSKARARLADLRSGSSRRQLRDEFWRLQLSHRRLERSLLEVRAGQQQLARMIRALAEAEQVRHAVPESELTALSTQMAAEVQRTREAHRSLHLAIDSLSSRMDAGFGRGLRTSVVAGDNVVASEVEGFIVGVPGEEWRLAAYHTFRGVLEPGLTRRFRETLRSGMVVVDVGANVGMYTLIAARAVGASGRVIAFEPTPRTFAILRDNIQINGLLETGRVELHDVAITDRIGTARFGVHAANSGHNTLFPQGGQVEVIDVATTTLDAVLTEVARVDVIKIDAEGAEPLIWAGMSGIVTRSAGIRIFVEFAPGLLQRGGHDPAEFLARIERDGFEVQVVDDGSGALRAGTYAQLRDVDSSNLMLTRKRR